MRLHLFASLAVALTLGACATTPRPSASYVDPAINSADAKTLADDAAAYLSGPLPPAHTTLVIDPPAARDMSDVLTPALQIALRAKGYGIFILSADRPSAKELPEPQTGTVLRYLANPLETGVVLRLQFHGMEASRFYQRSNDGVLLPNGFPFTVGGANEQ